jgi:hypothetical protein
VRFHQRGKRYECETFGGYSVGRAKFVLARLIEPCPNEGIAYQDIAVKVKTNGRIQLPQFPHEEVLGDEDWPRFVQLAEGSRFRIDGRTCMKMTRVELRRLLNRRVFVIC